MEGRFCSDTVFKLSNWIFSECEVKVLEKGLDFAPIQQKMKKPELRKDFEEFCIRMRTKWSFTNETLQGFSVASAFGYSKGYKETNYNKKILSQLVDSSS